MINMDGNKYAKKGVKEENENDESKKFNGAL